MAIVVEEAWDDASVGGGATEQTFIIRTDDGTDLAHGDAHDALLDETEGAPLTDGPLVRSEKPDLRRITDWAFLGRVQYITPAAIGFQPGEFEISFDISGQSQRIYQSLQTIDSYAVAGQTAPDFKGSINVTEDGPQGVDIIIPSFTYTRTYYIASATVTDGYVRTRADLVGTVSSSTIFGYPAGEMLLVGLAGSLRQSQDDWAVTFRWARRANVTGLTVGEITNIDKQGWDYLWTFSKWMLDGGTPELKVRRTIAAYVERVYPRADHAAALPS